MWLRFALTIFFQCFFATELHTSNTIYLNSNSVSIDLFCLSMSRFRNSILQVPHTHSMLLNSQLKTTMTNKEKYLRVRRLEKRQEFLFEQVTYTEYILLARQELNYLTRASYVHCDCLSRAPASVTWMLDQSSPSTWGPVRTCGSPPDW